MTDPDALDNPLEAWLARLCAELAVDPGLIDVTAVLDLARDAAHAVARPAAPLTAFVVGLAAGLQGGDRANIDALIERAQRLATGLA
jgi:Na+-transporting NADH:ubiquinone oxidoreductase subunit NqrD